MPASESTYDREKCKLSGGNSMAMTIIRRHDAHEARASKLLLLPYNSRFCSGCCCCCRGAHSYLRLGAHDQISSVNKL